MEILMQIMVLCVAGVFAWGSAHCYSESKDGKYHKLPWE
jgi:hypothetical protein